MTPLITVFVCRFKDSSAGGLCLQLMRENLNKATEGTISPLFEGEIVRVLMVVNMRAVD